MSSDCQRTDAALDALDEVQLGQIVGHGQTFIEFARILERELNQVGEMMVNAQNASVALVKERNQLKQQLEEEKQALTRVWAALGIDTYALASPLEVSEHVAKLKQQFLASQMREQRLREALEAATNEMLDKGYNEEVEGMKQQIDALSIPSDDRVVKEIREALEKAYEERYRENQQGTPFELSFAKHVKHALTLLGGEKDK